MNFYRSSTTMQMDAKYKAVKQSRCMARVHNCSQVILDGGTRFSSRLVGNPETGR
jgi:hypothetical protein